jgi:hypothetical protein
MKCLSLLLIAASASAADVSAVKAVYLLPMSRGLDQYIAQKLAARGVVQVVTDPQKADAIFSDRIGANFEESLTELFKPPEEVKAAAKPEDIPAYTRPPMQPLSRGKGNLFLVDLQSRTVIWSAFIPPGASEAKQLSQVADKVAEQLAKARSAKK